MLPRPTGTVYSHLRGGATGSLLIYSLFPPPFKGVGWGVHGWGSERGAHPGGLLHRHIMWRCGDSNPVPPACKAGALPSELHPRWSALVGHPGLEPGASVLSGLRSNHLS